MIARSLCFLLDPHEAAPLRAAGSRVISTSSPSCRYTVRPRNSAAMTPWRDSSPITGPTGALSSGAAASGTAITTTTGAGTEPSKPARAWSAICVRSRQPASASQTLYLQTESCFASGDGGSGNANFTTAPPRPVPTRLRTGERSMPRLSASQAADVLRETVIRLDIPPWCLQTGFAHAIAPTARFELLPAAQADADRGAVLFRPTRRRRWPLFARRCAFFLDDRHKIHVVGFIPLFNRYFPI